MSEIVVLRDGYGYEDETGTYRANGTITLVRNPSEGIVLLVDTGSPWDRDFLIQRLQEHGLSPTDVTHVVCTHGHVDHVGNLNLFTMATQMVSRDIVRDGDKYVIHELTDDSPFSISRSITVIPTPGHTNKDVSVVVQDTARGVVIIAGDLFECEEDLGNCKLWMDNSEFPELQETSRAKVLAMADCIVPGHGKIFEVKKEEMT
jgi:glyoxylase-like metal-dependent hydrolase (beta-lactamase superfamily II)